MFQEGHILTEWMSREAQQKPFRHFISFYKLKEISRDIDGCKPSPLPPIKPKEYKTPRIYNLNSPNHLFRNRASYVKNQLFSRGRQDLQLSLLVPVRLLALFLSGSMWFLLFWNGLMPENLQLQSLFSDPRISFFIL